jgi:hypothetical protein
MSSGNVVGLTVGFWLVAISFMDLRGKTIAVPNRFSNQKLPVVKALKEHGVALDPG